MKTRKRKRRNTNVSGRYRFRQKVHPKSAQIALILGIILIVWYAVFVGIAFFMGGVSPYFGSIGVLAMVLSFVALVLAVKSRFEDNVLMLYPNLALPFTLAACLFWFGTYGIGLTL